MRQSEDMNFIFDGVKAIQFYSLASVHAPFSFRTFIYRNCVRRRNL